jgi:hypothetical protein
MPPYPPPATEGVPAGPGPVYVPVEPGAWVAPCWIFHLDETFIQRSTTRSQPLFLDAGQQTVLNSQTNLNFPVQPGFDLSALCHFPSGWEIEFGYFQLDGWLAKNFVPGDSFLVVGDTTQTMPSTDTDVRYTSAIYLSEINLRRQVYDWLNVLVGFRGGEVDEDYSAFSDTVGFESRTTNSLFGFQIGADVRLLNTAPFHINALCKAGIFGNAIDQRSTLNTLTSSTALDQHANEVAFLGEIGLVATYELGPHLSARAFYQAVWLSGVALAPEQIAGTNFASSTLSVDAGGSLFYHGGGLGLEFRF